MMKIVSLVLFGLTIVSASYSMGQDYAAPSYAAPSYEDNYDDVKQNVHYEYIIKDNYGNEQSKKERIDDSSRDVEWHILQKGGYAAPVHSVPSYSAPSHPAQSYGAPSYSAPSYSAPAYSAPSYSAPSYSAPAYQKPTMAPYVSQKMSMHMVAVPKYHAPTYTAPSYSAPSYSAPSY